MGIALSLATLAPAGCGSDSSEGEAAKKKGEARLPALRFAGADLVYVLRRIAGAAGVLICLDEIAPPNNEPDLEFRAVDLDLPAGTVDDTMRALKEQVEGFDYTFDGRILYVRSVLTVEDRTGVDIGFLPSGTFEGDLEGLVGFIMQERVGSYLRAQRTPGEPIFRKVKFDVPENASILDVLLRYADQANRGWRIRRAGQIITDPKGEAAVIATTVELWGGIDKPRYAPKFRQLENAVNALVSVQARTGVPICILDRSAFRDVRGMLSFGLKRDPLFEIEETIDAIGFRHGGPPDFTWKWRDDIGELVLIETGPYKYYLTGRDLMQEQVSGGSFTGSLPELVRWIQDHRKDPSHKVLMGGEILDDLPEASIEVEDGTTILDVLVSFGKASDAGWYLVVQDEVAPTEPDDPILQTRWLGAFLTPLTAWKDYERMPQDSPDPIPPEELEKLKQQQQQPTEKTEPAADPAA